MREVPDKALQQMGEEGRSVEMSELQCCNRKEPWVQTHDLQLVQVRMVLGLWRNMGQGHGLSQINQHLVLQLQHDQQSP